MRKNKKHSLEFKLGIVDRIVQGQGSVKTIAKEHSLSYDMVRRWQKQFESFGVEGLKPRGGKALYPQSFKISVLQTIQEENLSLMEAMLHFNLPSPSIIVNWRKQVEAHGFKGLKPQVKGRPPMEKNDRLPNKRKKRASKVPLTREEQLQQELEYLRAENALLKKLHALVQKDSKRKP
jgi:transposase